MDSTRDGNLDQSDVDCLIAMVAGDSSCAPVDPTGLWVQDPDFNGDGNADQGDVSAIITGEPRP